MPTDNEAQFIDFIEDLPRIESGDSANLKIDTDNFRVWDSRVESLITLEFCQNGCWYTLLELTKD